MTGSHSAVDFDFETQLEDIAAGLNTVLPPLTNIVRPYRYREMKNIRRWWRISQESLVKRAAA
jgi:hypothetical protein